MTTATSLALLLAFASQTSPEVVELGDGRYRATTAYSGRSIGAATDAQVRLQAAARRVCRGRGDVVSEGLEVNSGARRNQRSLSETFACRSR